MYVPMPNEKERHDIIKKALGGISTSVTKGQIDYLAKVMEGFTGSDIKYLVIGANMCPVWKVAKAKFFTRKRMTFRCDDKSCNLWHPCHEKASGATPMSQSGLRPKEICQPMVTFQDLLAKLATLPRTVDLSILTTFKAQLWIKYRNQSDVTCTFFAGKVLKIDQTLVIHF